jgi:hypothetical protein
MAEIYDAAKERIKSAETSAVEEKVKKELRKIAGKMILAGIICFLGCLIGDFDKISCLITGKTK